MKRTLLFIGLVGLFCAVGCNKTEEVQQAGTVRNADGEVEGKAPTFVSVPAQNDPNNKR